MAEINLGNIRFNWKGAYAGGTAYVVDDVAESAGSSYVCILASTGNTPPNATYWNLMAEAGTDTSVLTTQGDVLYHNASALTRLPAGIAGQVLESGGAGANPSWATASGGSWTLVSSVTAAADSSLDITLSGSYSIYKITFVDMIGGSDNTFLNGQILVGGSVVTSNHQYSNWFCNSNGSGPGPQASAGASAVQLTYDAMGAAAGDNTNGEMILYNPTGSNSLSKHAQYKFSGTAKVGSYILQTIGGFSNNLSTNPYTGFRILYSSGTIASGTIKLWGQA
jgi:hypothetical protein|tara:strand:- start:357 stop:1196 length:840 start_codon:yes stop_codon:yes gene_type:complete